MKPLYFSFRPKPRLFDVLPPTMIVLVLATAAVSLFKLPLDTIGSRLGGGLTATGTVARTFNSIHAAVSLLIVLVAVAANSL